MSTGKRSPRFTSVRTKILASLLLTSVAAGGVGLVSVWQTEKVAQQGELIYAQALVPNQQLSALRETVIQARYDVVSRALATTIKTTAAAAMAEAALTADENKINTVTAAYAATDLNPRQRTLLAQFNRAWLAYKVVRDHQLTPLLTHGHIAQYEKVRETTLIPLVNQILATLDQLSDQADARARAALADARAAQVTARWIELALLAIGLVLAIGFGALIAHRIMQPVRLVRDVLDAVAANDLSRTAEAHTRDELGQMAAALNTSIAHLRSLHDALNRQALHDSLTGLPNRAAMTHILDQTLAAGERCAVLFIDLDGFKGVNDTLGHAGGDELLKMAAERIVACVRPSDVVARLGGDEFIVICRDVWDEEAVRDVARRAIERLTSEFSVGTARTTISASVGIALSDGGSTSESLLHQADLAMYRAKSSGKARFAVFATVPVEAVPRHRELQATVELELRHEAPDLRRQVHDLRRQAHDLAVPERQG